MTNISTDFFKNALCSEHKGGLVSLWSKVEGVHFKKTSIFQDGGLLYSGGFYICLVFFGWIALDFKLTGSHSQQSIKIKIKILIKHCIDDILSNVDDAQKSLQMFFAKSTKSTSYLIRTKASELTGFPGVNMPLHTLALVEQMELYL